MKKKLMISVLTVVAAVLLVSCACSVIPSPSPSPSASSALSTPMASPSPAATPESAPSPEASPAESPAQSEQSETADSVDTENIRSEVEKLSEVKSATVAVFDDTAVVGLNFDDAYKGTLTARITEMVTEKVQGADSGIKDVRVTADQTLLEEIKTFAEKKLDFNSTQAKSEFDTLIARLEPAS